MGKENTREKLGCRCLSEGETVTLGVGVRGEGKLEYVGETSYR